jgi:hypothetical protein
MGLFQTLIDWIKHKMGYLTSSDLLEYSQYLRYPEIYSQKFFVDTTLHDKILDEVFSQYSKDKKVQDKMVFGLRLLYMESEFFTGIVRNSILSAIEGSHAHVGHFRRLAFAYIIFQSCDKEEKIRASVTADGSQVVQWLGHFKEFMRSVKLSEGYLINELWEEFFDELRRIRPYWDWIRRTEAHNL